MKKLLLTPVLACFVLASCVSNPEGRKAETTEAAEVSQVEGQTVAIDTAKSEIVWSGHKVTGKHHGEIGLTDGQLVFDENGQLTGGDFLVNMHSIDVQDLEPGEYRDKLTGHLKSDDFFDVENHPEAEFTITSVSAGDTENQVNIAGNLQIRGTTKNITFAADTSASNPDHFVANADFNIARSDWGVSYKGKADDLISEEINLKVHLEAPRN